MCRKRSVRRRDALLAGVLGGVYGGGILASLLWFGSAVLPAVLIALIVGGGIGWLGYLLQKALAPEGSVARRRGGLCSCQKAPPPIPPREERQGVSLPPSRPLFPANGGPWWTD
jgi:hypothetical protein